MVNPRQYGKQFRGKEQLKPCFVCLGVSRWMSETISETYTAENAMQLSRYHDFNVWMIFHHPSFNHVIEYMY